MALTDLERAYAERALRAKLMEIVLEMRDDFKATFPNIEGAVIDGDLTIDGNDVRFEVRASLPESLWDQARDGIRAEMEMEGKS